MKQYLSTTVLESNPDKKWGGTIYIGVPPRIYAHGYNNDYDIEYRRWVRHRVHKRNICGFIYLLDEITPVQDKLTTDQRGIPDTRRAME